MKAHEAKRRVIDHLEDSGMVVYEQRVRHGLPALGQLVMVDPGNGVCRLVRVMVGKRPREGKGRLYFDRQRIGVGTDVVAMVDPKTSEVILISGEAARSHSRVGIGSERAPADAHPFDLPRTAEALAQAHPALRQTSPVMR